jgi:hypothetical protein
MRRTAGDHVGVAVQELGHGVHDNICAMGERLEHERRSERITDDE